MKKKYLVNNKEVEIEILKQSADRVSFKIGNKQYDFNRHGQLGDKIILESNNKMIRGSSFRDNQTGSLFVEANGVNICIEAMEGRKKSSSTSANSLTSPMPGKIFKVLAKVGDSVTKNQPLLIVEAMKMEHSIKANKDGVLKKILFTEGQQVKGGVLLAEIE